MRIRLSQLRRIIKEEVKRTLREGASAADLAQLDADIKKDLDGEINYYEGTPEDAAEAYDEATENITYGKFTPEEVVAAFKRVRAAKLDADIKKDMKPGGNNYYEGTAEQAARSYNDATENITDGTISFEEVVAAFVNNGFISDGSKFDDDDTAGDEEREHY